MDILASLTPIFKPKSVAVIGASTAPGKLGHDILANLKNGGFPGALYPINPKADEILGLKVYKSISDTPAAPDLAVVVIPARIVAATLSQCAEKGVKARHRHHRRLCRGRPRRGAPPGRTGPGYPPDRDAGHRPQLSRGQHAP